jgi:AcrR family transcriptional regulator
VEPEPGVEDPGRTEAALRVQSAARLLFSGRGFRATSVRDIMAACGLTPGAFYNHYPSKDQVLYDICRSTHELCDRYLYRALGSGSDPRSQLWHLTFGFVQFHADYADQARVTNQDFRELPDRWLEDIRHRRRRVRSMFEHVLAAGVVSGQFEAPRLGGPRAVRLLATAITNMGIRVSEWYVPGLEMTSSEIAAFHADVALRMTSGNGEAAFPIEQYAASITVPTEPVSPARESP